MTPADLLGALALAALAVGWALVQAAWRRSFPGAAPGGDALAGRGGCGGCGRCTETCERPAPGHPRTAPKELP